MAKRAIITGATGGLGQEFARQLDASGFSLTLVGRNKDRLEDVRSSLSGDAEIMLCDVENKDSLAEFCRSIEQAEAFDLLVSNAGFVDPKPLHLSSYDELDRHIQVNQISAMHVIRAVLPAMVARQSGEILCVSSMGGIVALENYTGYSSAKFALRGFLWSLAQEMKEVGVKVSGVYPGGIDTPMLHAEAQSEYCSPLNFMGNVSSAETVVSKALAGLKKGKLETYVPYGDSWTARILGFFPELLGKVAPMLSSSGKKGHQKYLEKIKGLGADS